MTVRKIVVEIRIDLYADPDPDPRNKTNADPYPDPDPGQTLKSQKVKKHTYEGTKVFLKGRKPGSYVNFGQFRCSWIWIKDNQFNADPCGFGSTTLVRNS
jgi:hypothetical protein